MLLQASSFSSGLLSLSLSHSRNCTNIISDGAHYRLLRGKAKTNTSSSSSSSTTTTTTFVCVSVGIDEIAAIAQNKVLIAAALSAAIGQLSKPFTSAIIYGNRNIFDFKAALQAGGFPSTHSSAVVATATSLGLERGFSDAVFGLAVVYAGIIMYDAQGVRREVGVHAKALNRVLLQNSVDADDSIDTQPRKPPSNPESFEPLFLEEASLFNTEQTNAKLLLRSENRKGQHGMLVSSNLASDGGESEIVSNSWALLKESIGHNEFEVIAGALLGLFVSLAVYTMA